MEDAKLTFVEELVDRVARDAAQPFAGFVDGVEVAILHGALLQSRAMVSVAGSREHMDRHRACD